MNIYLAEGENERERDRDDRARARSRETERQRQRPMQLWELESLKSVQQADRLDTSTVSLYYTL